VPVAFHADVFGLEFDQGISSSVVDDPSGNRIQISQG